VDRDSSVKKWSTNGKKSFVYEIMRERVLREDPRVYSAFCFGVVETEDRSEEFIGEREKRG